MEHPTPPQQRIDVETLDRARSDARNLARQSRYQQAAEALADVLDPAARALGSRHAEVRAVRQELADVLFEGGDFRRAGPLYQELVRTDDGSSDRDAQFEYRQREATCHALTGETSLALRQLTALLDDQKRAYGPRDDRVLELRRQLGLLELGAGHRDDAEATLSGLLTDLTATRGAAHPATSRVRELLDSLHSTHGPG